MHLTYILRSYHSAFHCRDPNQLPALTQTCMPADRCWNQSKHIGNSPLNSIIIARGHGASHSTFSHISARIFHVFLFFPDFQHVLPNAFLSFSLKKKNSQKGTSHVLAPQQTHPLCISAHCILSLHHRQAMHPCLGVLPVC